MKKLPLGHFNLSLAESGLEARLEVFCILLFKIAICINNFVIKGWKSRDQVPKLVEACQSGNLALDELVTHHFDFEEINKAFDLMNAGQG